MQLYTYQALKPISKESLVPEMLDTHDNASSDSYTDYAYKAMQL